MGLESCDEQGGCPGQTIKLTFPVRSNICLRKAVIR